MENYAPMAVPQPKMDPTDLIHMENLLQRNCYGRIIGIHLHDVGHIVPPFCTIGLKPMSCDDSSPLVFWHANRMLVSRSQ